MMLANDDFYSRDSTTRNSPATGTLPAPNVIAATAGSRLSWTDCIGATAPLAQSGQSDPTIPPQLPLLVIVSPDIDTPEERSHSRPSRTRSLVGPRGVQTAWALSAPSGDDDIYNKAQALSVLRTIEHAQQDETRGLDLVFTYILGKRQRGDVLSCDLLIAMADVDRLSITTLIGLLTVTSAVRSQMRHRRTFFNGTKRRIERERGIEEAIDLLRGLE